jgi:dTDP-4-dehydrorhamnose 3,5-epimerase
MEIIEEPLPGILVIKAKVFADERGHFFESFRKDLFESKGVPVNYVQDNQSLSNKGIIRGLHYQVPPFAQDKLVRVISGSVLDVMVDIRKSSPTYGQSYSIELTGENFLMVFIPKGFAHGFETLADKTIFTYKCTDYYHPASEGGVAWDSPELSLPWRTKNPILSEKDKNNVYFKDFVTPFS